MKKVLITGASGFIGKALSERLSDEGVHVIKMNSSDGNVSSLSTWKDIAFNDVSHVYHLAGKVYVPDSWDEPYEFYKVNTLGTEAVLEFCRKNSLSMTYVSAYIYGIPQALPISENAVIAPSNPYAHSKYLGEELCRFYASTYGMNISIIRPFNVYGIGQSEKFLIPSIVRQVLYEDKIFVKDLSPRRDYVYISDLVEALVSTSYLEQGFHIFNIGSGQSYSVEDVIQIVQLCVGTNKPVLNADNTRPNEIPDVKASISLARKFLYWNCRVSFEEGIAKIVRWEQSK